MNSSKGGNCWKCNSTLSAFDYGRADTCKSCGFDTKVCLNCIFYNENVNNKCNENQAERVVDKERSNFCDYFTPKNHSSSASVSKDALKNAAEALFKKKV